MAAKSRVEYNEVSRAKISDSRNIVISTCSKGGYTIAQQLVAQEDGKTTSVFMKGAFHVDDVHGLYELRDAINLAILAIQIGETNNSEDGTWDE